MNEKCAKCQNLINQNSILIHTLHCNGQPNYQEDWGQFNQLDKSCQFCGQEYPDYLMNEHLQVCGFQNEFNFDDLQEGEEMIKEEILKNGDIRQQVIRRKENNEIEKNDRIIKAQQIQQENMDDCSICYQKLDPKDNLTNLPCMHKYHKKCITPWLKQQQKCPMCKFDIKQ